MLTTQLTDSSGTATGTATYSTSTVDGTTTTNFTVSITGTTADTSYDVAIGGTVVGQITTDSSGAGTLSLSSNPTSSQQALPSNFPTTVAAGTAVTVGTLSGTLATSTDMSGGCGGEGEGGGLSDVTRLTAALTDSSSTATGKVSYTTGTADDGTTVTRFKVTVTGATASTTLDVAVGAHRRRPDHDRHQRRRLAHPFQQSEGLQRAVAAVEFPHVDHVGHRRDRGNPERHVGDAE